MTEERSKELTKCFQDYDPNTKKNIYAFLLQANLLDDEHSSVFSVLLDITPTMLKEQPDTVKAAQKFIDQLS